MGWEIGQIVSNFFGFTISSYIVQYIFCLRLHYWKGKYIRQSAIQWSHDDKDLAITLLLMYLRFQKANINIVWERPTDQDNRQFFLYVDMVHAHFFTGK